MRIRLVSYFAFAWMVLMGGLIYIESEDRAPANEPAPVVQAQMDEDAAADSAE